MRSDFNLLARSWASNLNGRSRAAVLPTMNWIESRRIFCNSNEFYHGNFFGLCCFTISLAIHNSISDMRRFYAAAFLRVYANYSNILKITHKFHHLRWAFFALDGNHSTTHWGAELSSFRYFSSSSFSLAIFHSNRECGYIIFIEMCFNNNFNALFLLLLSASLPHQLTTTQLIQHPAIHKRALQFPNLINSHRIMIMLFFSHLIFSC